MVREPYAEEEVAEGVWQISGSHGCGLGVNAVVLDSRKRAIVVDSMYRPPDARRMIKSIRRRRLEPQALVNTHWHTDHTIGNCLYDCPIWAQERLPKFLRKYWPKWVGTPRDKRAQGLKLRLPDHLFRRRVSLDLDGTEVRLLHIPGHTPDSIGVLLPDRRIFIAGDTVMTLPFIAFGDSLQEIRTLRRIQRLRPRMIIQGHGPPCGPAQLAGDIRYLQRLREEARRAKREGVTKEKFLETPVHRVLSGKRDRELPAGFGGLHRGNLWKVWDEIPTPR